jgi:hypothetical protein
MRHAIAVRTAAAVAIVVVLASGSAGAQELFIRGNANGNGGTDLSDGIWTLNFLFRGGPAPPCPDGADANDDGDVDLSDVIFTLNYLFRGGPEPPAPGPDVCGPDPTADGLGPCRDPECAGATCIDLSFPGLGATIGGASAELVAAARDRMLAPEYAYLQARLAADASSSSAIVILESYDRDSELLSFVYARVPTGMMTVDAATNIDVVAEPFGPAVSEPGPIVEASVPFAGGVLAAISAIEASPAVSGGGGDAAVDGGMVHFLSVQFGGRCVQHAVHGYDFPVHGDPFSLNSPTANPDLDRYNQDDLVYDLWIDVFGPPILAPIIALADGDGDGDGDGAGTGGIVIEGDNDFKRAVLDALMQISPCYIYTLVQCRVQLQSPADFDAFCRCYCQHLAGTNLICDLGLSTRTTTIKKTKGGNSHQNGCVKWNPDRRQGGRNADGNRDRPPKIGLAHELIHAKHTHCGTRGAGSQGGISNEEINTCRGENQIRGECGQPKRTHYGDNEIPNNCDENLDDSNRTDCPKPEEGN